MNTPKPFAEPVNIAELGARADRAKKVLARVRHSVFAPGDAKRSPTFSTAQLAAIVQLDQRQVDYRVRKGILPPGSLNAGGRREMSVSDVRTWSRELRAEYMRPAGAEALVCATCNFKGGVAKTTTTMALAQGLSLRGHRVLAIDCDPQGSFTTLFGVVPEIVDAETTTILPLCLGDQDSIEYAIQPTYWNGIDLVPATPALYSAEFALPGRQRNEAGKGFQFWNVLHYGIEKARQEYDIILIDTPPSLSYVTINAMMAADGLLMPLPPSNLDFASSVQFWGLFHELGKELTQLGRTKEYAFVDVLLSKVDMKGGGGATEEVRKWIASAYGDSVLPITIPKTAAADAASAEFGSVYDMRPSTSTAHRTTIKRALDAYEQLVETVEQQIIGAWARQVQPLQLQEAA